VQLSVTFYSLGSNLMFLRHNSAMTLVVIRRPLTVRPEIHARSIRVRFVFYIEAERLLFLRHLGFPLSVLFHKSPFAVK
jgi:hypothetical protein